MKLKYVAYIRGYHVFQILNGYRHVGALHYHEPDGLVTYYQLQHIIYPGVFNVDELKREAVNILADYILLEE